MAKKILDHDLTRVYGERRDPWKNKTEQNKLSQLLCWGGEVEMPTPSQATDDAQGKVDVQQGDATLIRTPDRKLIVVDGGEEVFLARILHPALQTSMTPTGR